MSTCAVMVAWSEEQYEAFTPCWIWQRGTSAGRPVFYETGRHRNAYRVTWEQIHGVELDQDTILKRLCRQSLCVNPAHFREQPRKLGQRPRQKYPEKQRGWNLKKYGLTLEQYDALLEAQGGVCAVCLEDRRDRMGRRLHVDHDHETGRVRGLLCMRCNNAIGQAGESAATLRALADYLEGSPKSLLAA